MEVKKNFDPSEAEAGTLADDKLQQVTGGYDAPVINDEQEPDPTDPTQKKKKKSPPREQVIY